MPYNQTAYSVYVGHLHKDVGKKELCELFQHCGHINGVHVADYRVDDPYYYGFVRFSEAKAALTAVRELDKWSVKGLKMTVELSKETQEKLKEDGLLPQKTRVLTKTGSSLKEKEKTKMTVDYMMKESRFRDCCAGINIKQGPEGHKLNAEKILADVSNLEYRKPPVLHGDVIGDDLGNISYIKREMNKREKAGKIPQNSTTDFFNILQEILHNVVDIAREDEETPPTAESGPQEDKTLENQAGEPQFVASLATAVRKTYVEPAKAKRGKSLVENGNSCVPSLKKDLDPGEIGRSRRLAVEVKDTVNDGGNDKVVGDKVDGDPESVSGRMLHVSGVCLENVKRRDQVKYASRRENNVDVNAAFNDEQNYDKCAVSSMDIEDSDLRLITNFEQGAIGPFNDDEKSGECAVSSTEIEDSDLKLITYFEQEFNNDSKHFSPNDSSDSDDDEDDDDQRYQRFHAISTTNSQQHKPCDSPEEMLSSHGNEFQNRIHAETSYSDGPKSLVFPSPKSEQEYYSASMNKYLSNRFSTGLNVSTGPLRLPQNQNVSKHFIDSERGQSESLTCREFSSRLKQLNIDNAQEVSKSQELLEISLKNSTNFDQHSECRGTRPVGRGLSSALQKLRSMEVRPGSTLSSLHSSSHPQISKSSSPQSPPPLSLASQPWQSPESLPSYQKSLIKMNKEIPSMLPPDSSETVVLTRTRFRESSSSNSSLRHSRDLFASPEFIGESNPGIESEACSKYIEKSYEPRDAFPFQDDDSCDERTHLGKTSSRRHSDNKQRSLGIFEDHSYASKTHCRKTSPNSDIAGADSGVESDGFHNYRPIKNRKQTSNSQDKVTSASFPYLSRPAEVKRDQVGKVFKTMIGRGRGYLNQQN